MHKRSMLWAGPGVLLLGSAGVEVDPSATSSPGAPAEGERTVEVRVLAASAGNDGEPEAAGPVKRRPRAAKRPPRR